MISIDDWIHNEFQQVGKDYGSKEEVAVYDESHAKFRDVDKECNELLDKLSVSPGETFIDFGCGTGALAIQAALRGVSVVAVDISPAMLSYAESKANDADIDTIEFIKSGLLNISNLARAY